MQSISVEVEAAQRLTDSYVAQQSHHINDFLCRNHEFQSADVVSYYTDECNPPIRKPSLAFSKALWPEKLWVPQNNRRATKPQGKLDVILVSAAAFTPNGYIAYPDIENFRKVGPFYSALFNANPQATKIAIGFSCQMISSATMNYIWYGPVDVVITDTGIYKWRVDGDDGRVLRA